MTRVLVVGASGYLGRHLVNELKQRDYWVRVLVRSTAQAKTFTDLVDDVVIGQVTQSESLVGVASGIDWICSSLGITRQRDGLSYQDVDYQGNLNVLREAEQAGVTRFLYVSVLNAHKMPKLAIIRAKEAFVDALRASKLDTYVIRPSGFFSDMREFLEMAQRGRVFVFGKGDIRANPISGRDLAKVCVDDLETSLTQTNYHHERNVGGPVVYSQREVAELAFETLGKPAVITAVPLWLVRAAIPLLRLVTPTKVYGPLEFFLSALSMPMVAERHGHDQLDAFYLEQARHLQSTSPAPPAYQHKSA
jgi:uncharacterized protein YbjT (DUF2867 family)